MGELREILDGLAKKLDSGTCTPLEVYNIKMYVSSLNKDGFRRMVEKEMNNKNQISFWVMPPEKED